MTAERTIDTIHQRISQYRLLQLLTGFSRVLLAVGFIPPSLPKIMGAPFTLLPPNDPVGHYFDALLQTGFYYNFLGWAQLTAALLLLFPRTSHIGALMFLPIIANIAVLTTSVGFKGTWIVTIFMFLAATYLVCWDYPRWKTILFQKAGKQTNFSLHFLSIASIAVSIGASLAFVGLMIVIGNSMFLSVQTFGVVFLGSLVFSVLVSLQLRFMSLPADNRFVNDLD